MVDPPIATILLSFEPFSATERRNTDIYVNGDEEFKYQESQKTLQISQKTAEVPS